MENHLALAVEPCGAIRWSGHGARDHGSNAYIRRTMACRTDAVRAPSQTVGGRQLPGIPKILTRTAIRFRWRTRAEAPRCGLRFRLQNELMGKEALKLNPDNLVVDELVVGTGFVSEVRALGFDAAQATDSRGKEGRLNLMDRNAVDFATRTPSSAKSPTACCPSPPSSGARLHACRQAAWQGRADRGVSDLGGAFLRARRRDGRG